VDEPLPSNLVEMWQKFFDDPEPLHQHHGQAGQSVMICHELFCTDLFPLQRKRELMTMLLLAESVKPKVIMDIGSDKGAGLHHWCRLPTVEKVVACEIRGLPYAKLFEQHFPKIEFLWLPMSSYDCQTGEDSAKDRVRKFLGSHPLSLRTKRDIDVLFIDGDKSMFLTDFNLYQPLMSRTGIVFMHDITDPAPGEAYRKVQAGGAAGRDYKTFDIIDTTESIEMLFREPRNGHEAWLKHWAGRSCGVGCIFMGDKR
jgi:hypothetical protein